MQVLIEGDGFVAIPETVRERMGLVAGDRVDLSLEADNRLIIRKTAAAREVTPGADRFERARGSAGPGPTTDEMMLLLRGDPEG